MRNSSKYGSGFDMTSNAWWTQNLPSMASAATFILPMAIVGRGASLATRGLGKAVKQAGAGSKWLKNLSQVEGVELSTQGARLLEKSERAAGTIAGEPDRFQYR